jgi:hypothetical protein
MRETLPQLVGEYANTVGKHGVDSEQARRFRKLHETNKELLDYCDSLDRIKRHLQSKGLLFHA